MLLWPGDNGGLLVIHPFSLFKKATKHVEWDPSTHLFNSPVRFPLSRLHRVDGKGNLLRTETRQFLSGGRCRTSGFGIGMVRLRRYDHRKNDEHVN